MAEDVFSESVQYIQTVDLVTLGYWQIEGYEGNRVGFGDTEGTVETGDEVGELAEVDELGGVGVVSEGRRVCSIFWSFLLRKKEW